MTLRFARAVGLMFSVAAYLCSAAPARAAASRHLLRPSDLRRFVGLSGATVSEDGRQAAVLVKRISWNNDRTLADLDLFDLASGARRTLLHAQRGLSAPAFSPSGTEIAFLDDAGKGKNAKPQVWVLRLPGGAARAITSAPAGVDQFAWSRDGSSIAYAAPDARPKRTGAARFRDSFIFTTEPIVVQSAPSPVHLFVLRATGGRARQLTFGTRSVASGEAASTISWSSGDRTIAFVLAPDALLNDSDRARIELLDVATGTMRRLTNFKGDETMPLWSPDGTHIAYLRSSGDNQSHQMMAYVTTPGDGHGVPVSKPLDANLLDVAWVPDSTGLFCTYDHRTSIVMAQLVHGKSARAELRGLTIQTNLNGAIARDGTLVFAATKASKPAEFYVREPNGAIHQLSDYNGQAASLVRFAAARAVTFETTMGIEGDAVLLEPPGFTQARRYPLVLLIHGGPTGESTTSFDALGQLMAARGWLVLSPNYRGSDGLGRIYMRGVLYDPEEGPGKDIMAGVRAVEALGIVDPNRIAVSGWSYGGIMTAWMISKYHIWKAAVSGASVNDWFTDYGVADDSDSDRALFHGSPYVGQNWREWYRASAISYAADVTTPVLILSDIRDNRDPFATSSMYWRALRDNHKDATLRVWPIYGHFPSDPVRRFDVYRYWIDYIAQHFER